MTVLLEAKAIGAMLSGRTVLEAVDLTLDAGEMVAVIGPNGAGKTTLIRRLAGLLDGPGAIRLADTPIDKVRPKERARRIGYLPQGHLFHWPLPVADIVALGRLPHGGSALGLGAADLAAVHGAMETTGILDFAERPVTSLSGGERARVALARVLAGEPDIILADEPVSALDLRYQIIVLDLLKARAAAGAGVILVLHDLALAARYADRIVLMDQGRIRASGTPEAVVTPKNLSSAFGIETEVVSHRGHLMVLPVEGSAAPIEKRGL